MNLSYKILQDDPFGVLASTAKVAQNFKFVAIVENRLENIAAIVDTKIKAGLESADVSFCCAQDFKNDVQLVFFEDVVNFSFWSDSGSPRWMIKYPAEAGLGGGWYSLVAGFRRAIDKNVPILHADFMADLTLDECREIFIGDRGVDIPMAEARQKNLNEAGKILRDEFGGHFLTAVESADFDAVKIVKLLYEKFPSFRDEAVCDGQRAVFLKRAQICVSDISLVLEKYDKGVIKNIGQLTAFADYRLPQVLRNCGMIEYAGELARKIDNHVQIIPESREEIDIRSAVIWCVEFIRQKLGEYTAGQIDNALWLISQNQPDMKPHHRARTIFY